MLKKGLFISLVVMSLTGCYEQSANSQTTGTKIDQNTLCRTSALDRKVIAQSCNPGQKLVFLPNSFGNEQLPIIFAAANCDHRYSIALTKGAVSCIYLPANQQR
jgi:hypothetical protein